MTNKDSVVRCVEALSQEVPNLLAAEVADQRERESYYLSQEGWIRQRVQYLDEIQALIGRERDILKDQHDFCRNEIMKCRRTTVKLEEVKSKFLESKDITPSIQLYETQINSDLETITAALNDIESSIDAAMTQKRQKESEHEELKREKDANIDLIEDLLDRIECLEGDQREFGDSIVKLDRQCKALIEWSDRLNQKEGSLSSKKSTLLSRCELLQMYVDDGHPVVRLHDFFGEDMTIEREDLCEEIDH